MERSLSWNDKVLVYMVPTCPWRKIPELKGSKRRRAAIGYVKFQDASTFGIKQAGLYDL